MANLFGIGISGLQVAQRGLATTGHNIANVDTPGYSRQRIDVTTRPAQSTGAGFFGAGAQVSSVARVFDQFLATQVRVSTSASAEFAKLDQFTAQLDNLLANPSTGVTPALSEFFASMQALADDPSSVAARQVALTQAGSLADRFNSLNARMDALRGAVNSELQAVVNEINVLTTQVGELNARIGLAEGGGNGNPANDLRDQRDEVIRQLAERVDVSVFEDNNGSANLTIGGGQALVIGTTVATLRTSQNEFDPTQLEVSYTIGGTSFEVSNLLGGGEIRGILDFRNNVLDPAQDGLGRVAAGLAAEVNQQHQLGLDLDGQPGGDFFSDLPFISPAVLPSTANTGAPPANISAELTDVGQVDIGGYLLERVGAAHTLTRLSDNTVFTLANFPGTTETIDGITLSLGSGAIADGDSFLIRPVRDGARDIQVSLSNVRQIATGVPILASAALGNAGQALISSGSVNSPANRLEINFTSATTFDVVDQTTGATLATAQTYVSGGAISFNGLSFDITGAPNTGDGFVVDGKVTSALSANAGSGVISVAGVAPPDPNLTDPVTITFDDPPTSFSVAGATTGSPVTNVPFTSGGAISFNGWTVEIAGTPQAGDVFSVAATNNGVGDNRNVLSIAALQNEDVLENNDATLGESYGRIVALVGTEGQRASANFAANTTLLQQAIDERDSVSGVNLDEEAANLLRLQQSFDANARVIAIAGQIFDSLLGAVGG